MADEKKKPEAKPELKGIAVFVYPLSGGRYRVVSCEVDGERMVGRPHREGTKDAKRSALALGEDMLIALAQEKLR